MTYGFDYQDYGKGLTKTNITYILDKNKTSHLRVGLDITAASLAFPPLDWEKEPGEKGEDAGNHKHIPGRAAIYLVSGAPRRPGPPREYP